MLPKRVGCPAAGPGSRPVLHAHVGRAIVGYGGCAVWVTAATGGAVRRRAVMPGTSPMPRAIWRASRATEPPRLWYAQNLAHRARFSSSCGRQYGYPASIPHRVPFRRWNLDTLNLWMERARDRARAISFGRFLWHRFLDDRLFQQRRRRTPRCSRWCRWRSWCSVLSAFPSSTAGRPAQRLRVLQLRALCGTCRRRLPAAVLGQCRALTAAGFIALVVSLLITLNSVEETFNQIWRVGSTRPS